jgi:hypothetical protein
LQATVVFPSPGPVLVMTQRSRSFLPADENSTLVRFVPERFRQIPGEDPDIE